MMKKYLLLATVLLVTACAGLTYKADTYDAKILTDTLREYVELPLCTDVVVAKCHTKEIAKTSAAAAEQWKKTNATYMTAVEKGIGITNAKADNDVSLAVLRTIAESETVTAALAK